MTKDPRREAVVESHEDVWNIFSGGLDPTLMSLFLIVAQLSTSSVPGLVNCRVLREVEVMGKEAADSGSQEGTDELLNELMGREECRSDDDECLARRMVAEAHLDYIYTQPHKP